MRQAVTCEARERLARHLPTCHNLNPRVLSDSGFLYTDERHKPLAIIRFIFHKSPQYQAMRPRHTRKDNLIVYKSC